ncbi:serine palmitoyltransferase small subunit B-like [Hemicordylus capensis]|uniref:serine palmitoyltransferase small subunit B-like n=1 Tax=Hemicordylus capensis TaxID=884348 RepID=UPI00230311D9|nr:serine palmitoyltransferase small subunit B-like [Hemicordylus capensis]
MGRGVVRMTNFQEIITGYRTNFQKQRLMAMKATQFVKDYIYWAFFQYRLLTCCFDLEPWERVLVHSGVVIIFTMSVFTAYVFIPIHLRLVFWYFLQLLVK